MIIIKNTNTYIHMDITTLRTARSFSYKLAERTKMQLGEELSISEFENRYGSQVEVMSADEVINSNLHSNIKNKAVSYPTQLFLVYRSVNLVLTFSGENHKLVTPLFLNGRAGYSRGWKLDTYEGQRY